MEIVVLICLVFALEKAIEFGSKKAKASASMRWQASKATRPAAGAGRVGSAVGRGLGAGTAAAFHGGRGFASGWREGWPTGWQQGSDWHTRRQAARTTPLQAALDPTHSTTAPAPDPVDPLDDRPVPQVKPRQRLTEPRWQIDTGDGPVPVFTEDDLRARLDRARADGKPVSWQAVGGEYPVGEPPTPAPNQQQHNEPRPDSPAEPDEGEHDMSTIDTITGGEVYTMDQLIAELQTIQNEAVSELEDATGDAQRAKEDASRVELMVASLTTLRLDSQSLGEIGALAEDAQSRLAAAEQRQAAAESRAAHAQAAADGVQQRHGAIREHADTMAERAFYQG